MTQRLTRWNCEDIVNKEAWTELMAAEDEYLFANGWNKVDDGAAEPPKSPPFGTGGMWHEPGGRPDQRVLRKNHAVNAQKYWDQNTMMLAAFAKERHDREAREQLDALTAEGKDHHDGNQ